MSNEREHPDVEREGLITRLIGFCLENKLVVALALIGFVVWGVAVAPFDWDIERLPRDPVPVDAIPDIGENQQIIFTRWPGRSPRDVEDQITYPLTVSLMGIPGVRTVRSQSMFGFSQILVIFEEEIEFYWSRSRIIEKLNSLPADTLPEGVQPALGPDATALGQIYWYTLEGRDPEGNPAGGWTPQELRSIQDWTVRYGLLSAEGISEIGSVGGFVQEYQIDVDPNAMRSYGVTLTQVFDAVRMSNVDVGARTIELNRVEYVIRGLGFVENLEDIEQTVIAVRNNVPILVKNVARVARGPALRRGALDKDGAEAVGGVAVVRYGYNPLEAIENVKAKIAEIAPGLPVKAVVDWAKTSPEEVSGFADGQGFEAFGEATSLNQPDWLDWLQDAPHEDWPEWVTTSRVTVVPFYDRTGLIHETLGTLDTALIEEILVTIIVVVLTVLHLRSSLLIGSALPLAVLMCFIAMKLFGVDANIVALSGIAIAIGTIVDMSIIVCENILRHLEEAQPDADRLAVVRRAAGEVGSAVLTAVLTTVIGFLPVFAMSGAEGKLFRPLAFTKTFALIASVIVALTIVPAGAHLLFTNRIRTGRLRGIFAVGLFIAAVLIGAVIGFWWVALLLIGLSIWLIVSPLLPERVRRVAPWAANIAAVIFVGVILTQHWEPLGPERGLWRNLIFVGGLIGGLLMFFALFRRIYAPLLRWCLDHKALFLAIPATLLLLAALIWLGFDTIFGWVPDAAARVGMSDDSVRATAFWRAAERNFPGLGKEFMPPLDEGSFLLMPTTMPHASIGEALDVLQKQDRAIRAIPEVSSVVGKIGRADTALDPAPISMVETVINYHSEYATDEQGRRLRFAFDPTETDFARNMAGEAVPAPDGDPYKVRGTFLRDEAGELVPDPDGMPFRIWRAPLDPELNPGREAWPGIESPDDIWARIQDAASIPGTTAAPKLQPINARIVMLQSGMRAPLGVKVFGPDLEGVEQAVLAIEGALREAPNVRPETVTADRVVGKPYIEIDVHRPAIARYGIPMRRVQDVIEVAIGGRRITTTVEGRERYPVRVRYMRELRDRIETLGGVLVPAPDGTQVPLRQLATINTVRGPQAIKTEDTFLVGYVIFDRVEGAAEVDVVEGCKAFLEARLDSGELKLPDGVTWRFAGTYRNQLRARRTLSVVLPLALFVIFMILYFQFRSVPTSLLVFSGILVAWAGGFLLIWLYGQPWFMDFTVFGVEMRELFQISPVNLSVAVWVGFLALFGIASDNGVVIATYLNQSFAARPTTTPEEIREATVAGALRRLRPCLMTSATTILALLPVLTSRGRGSDVMVPMAIPSFGGMCLVLVTVFSVPVLYSAVMEFKLKFGMRDPRLGSNAPENPETPAIADQDI